MARHVPATVVGACALLAGTAGVSVAPEAAPRCANEPAGMTRVSDEAWGALPPDLPAHAPSHWAVDRGRPGLSIVRDPTAPHSGPAVLEGRFPRGLAGGYSPFSIALDFPAGAHYTALYQCFVVKHSPNFTHNGNLSTKMGFYRGTGTNHGWRFGSHDRGDGRFFFEFFLQGETGYRDIGSRFDAQPLGRWREFEVLVVGNRRGRGDGVLRAWADGREILDRRDVAFWGAHQRPGFRGIAFEPTYGGGRNAAPAEMRMWVDHWRVSGRP